jgi:HEAT repeat protein
MGTSEAVRLLIDFLLVIDESDREHYYVRKALIKIGNSLAVYSLLRSRENSWWDVVKLNDPVPELIRALNSKEKRVLINAACALGEIGDPRAQSPLIEVFFLTKSHSLESDAMATSLGKIGGRASALALLKKLDEELDAFVIRALGETGDPIAVPALISKLDGLYKYDVAKALGKIGDRRAVPKLISLLGHKDFSMRRSASEALGLIGDKSATSELVRLLDDGAGVVAWTTADALGNIRDESAIQSLIEKSTNMGGYTHHCVDALVKIGASSMPALCRALNHKNDVIRETATKALDKLPGVNYLGGSRQLRRRVAPLSPPAIAGGDTES